MPLHSLGLGLCRHRVPGLAFAAVALVTACHPGRDDSVEAPSQPAEAEAPPSPAHAGSPETPAEGAPSEAAPAEGGMGGTPSRDPTEAPASSAECDTRKAAILARFTEAARCKADTDCTTMMPGCPFGCGLAINKAADLTPLNDDIAAYNQSCNRCMYRCRPIEQPPVCRAGLCSLDAAQP
jgi:hypothetical protein